MNQKIIEQIRHIVQSENWPISINEWPEELNKSTNCIAFALGLPISDKDGKLFNSPDTKIKDDLLTFFEVMGLNYREIEDIKEAKDDEIIIQGYDYWQIMGGDDSHVVRRELDGTWVHKQGWNRAPIIIEDLNNLHCNMHPKDLSCIFAVTKSAS